MDIAKLLKQEAQFSADVAEILKGRKPTPADLQRPLDLQQEQLTRVTDRIQALEEEKKAAAARIDAEIAELKGELGSRQRAMDAQREGLKAAMNAAKATGRAGSTGLTDAKPFTASPRSTAARPVKTAAAKTRAKSKKP
jgi:chromosome segregation ATPase